MLSSRAKHPQVSTAGEQLVWVWDEAISTDGSGEMGSFVQRIGMRTFAQGKASATAYITPETVNATYPAVLATKHGVLLAYEQTKDKGNSTIVVRTLEGL